MVSFVMDRIFVFPKGRSNNVRMHAESAHESSMQSILQSPPGPLSHGWSTDWYDAQISIPTVREGAGGIES
jgi:hypothetical protein